MISILIVEDHPWMRAGIRGIVSNVYRDTEWIEAGSAKEAWEQLGNCNTELSPSSRSGHAPNAHGDGGVREAGEKHSLNKPDLAIVDLTLPQQTGLEFLEQLKEKWPDIPVLMIGDLIGRHHTLRALKGGAAGYLDKYKSSRELLVAIGKILTDGNYMSAQTTQHLVEEVQSFKRGLPHTGLSEREQQVLNRLAQGQSLELIAEEMTLGLNTVRTYRERILKKLGLRNTTELIRYAMQHGLDKA